MTIENWDGPQRFTIIGTGPYSVPWPYLPGGLVLHVVAADGARTILDRADWTVAPEASDDGGNIGLAPAAAALHAGSELVIYRATPVEQGWQGLLGERERGMEEQLDELTMAVQEVAAAANAAVRSDAPMPPMRPVPGATIIFGPDGAPMPGPTAAEISSAQTAAETAMLALAGAQEAAGSMREQVTTPDIIPGRHLAGPAVSVLGYAETPGARNDWVLAPAPPAHGFYRTDAAGRIWVPNDFSVRAEHFGDMRQGRPASAALQTALDFALARGFGQILLPPGIYVLDQAITANTSAARKIAIAGAGSEATTLQMDAASTQNGIALVATDSRTAATHLRDFSVVIDGQAPTGTAIRTVMTPGGVQDRISAQLERLRVSGLNIETDYIGTMFDVTGHWRPRLIDLFGTGCWGPGVVAPNGLYANDSPLFRANVGLNFDGCYSAYIHRCRMSSCKEGFRSIGTAEEAWYLLECVANQVRTGYRIKRTDPEPLGYMTNCYSSYRDKGIHIDGGKLLRITNPYLDQIDPEAKAVSAPVDVLLENVTDVRVTGGVHNYAGDPRRIGYQVYPVVRAQRILIDDFSMVGTYAEAVRVGAGAVSVTIKPGDLSAASIGTEISNGAGANCRVIRDKPLRTAAYVSVAQSIPASAWTAINWTADTAKSTAGNAVAGTTITVPANRGIRHARVKVRAGFSADSTGTRGLRLRKNNYAVNYGLMQFESANNGANEISGVSGEIDVTAGDELVIETFQTATGALDLLTGPAETWVQIEWL